MSQHDHGLGLRQVADIATHHRKIDLSGRERSGKFERSRGLDQAKPDRRFRLGELAGDRRNELVRLPIQRTDGDSESGRPKIPAIGQQSGPPSIRTSPTTRATRNDLGKLLGSTARYSVNPALTGFCVTTLNISGCRNWSKAAFRYSLQR
ncbi:hypothetical protein ACVIGB_003331 [Bradyrhizobium sp. USDA 4341]